MAERSKQGILPGSWQERSVTGRVRFFMPAVRRGIVQAESGEELPFSVPQDGTQLQGGDIVEFERIDHGPPRASNITLRHRWAEVLDEQHRPLINQFHQTIRIHS